VSKWTGIMCMNDSVTGIDIRYEGFQGTLPNSIGDLRNLTALILLSNSLSGTIPQSLMTTKLEVFRIESNLFSSPLPTNFFGMPTLKVVRMERCFNLNESWPTVWSPNMIQLQATLSEFTGLLPTEMASMTKLEELDLNYNTRAMNGSFPPFIATMTSLRTLYLGYTGITSPLPSLCALSNLTELSLSGALTNDNLSGLSCLKNLKSLYYSDANLTGTIPNDLSTNLTTLYLDRNALEGELPAQLVNLPWRAFAVGFNRFARSTRIDTLHIVHLPFVRAAD
jgi:Leucine-rich repeat (LRR) protein